MERKTLARYVLGAVATMGFVYGGYVGFTTYRTEQQRKEQRLSTVENKVGALENKSIETGQQLGQLRNSFVSSSVSIANGFVYDDARLKQLSNQYAQLSEQHHCLEEEQIALKGQLSGLSDVGNTVNVLSQVTNSRLTQIENNLEKASGTVMNFQTTLNNKIKLIEKNLITINETFNEEEQEKEQAMKGITTLAYLMGKEVQYVGFSVQQPEQNVIPVIEAVMEEYSKDMQMSRRAFTKETPEGLVLRTELLYTKDHQRNMLIVEQKENSAYVFLKMQGNDETKALKDIVARCKLPLSPNAKDKFDQLTHAYDDDAR